MRIIAANYYKSRNKVLGRDEVVDNGSRYLEKYS